MYIAVFCRHCAKADARCADGASGVYNGVFWREGGGIWLD